MNTLIIDFGDSYIENIASQVEKIRGKKAKLIKIEDYNVDLLKSVDSVILSSGTGSYRLRELLKSLEKENLPVLGTSWSFFSILDFFEEEIESIPPQYGVKIYGHFLQNNSYGLLGTFNGILYDKYSIGRLSSEIEILSESEEGDLLAFKKNNFVGVRPHLGSYYTERSKDVLNIFIENARNQSRKNHELIIHKEKYEDNLPSIVEKVKKDHKIYWLDSSHVIKDYSRFSILGIPREEDELLSYSVGDSFVSVRAGKETSKREGTIWDILKKRPLKSRDDRLPVDFQCGYIGAIGYGLKEDLGYTNKNQSKLPDCILQYCSSCIIVDHLKEEIYLVSEKEDDHYKKIKGWLGESRKEKLVLEKRRNNFPKAYLARSREEYISDIKKSLEKMRKGESLEICLTNQLMIEDSIDSYEFYKILRKTSPAPYAGYLEFEDFSIASSSMERFVKLDGNGNINAKPIKGTIRRGETSEEDEELKRELQEDKKSFSENLMILDLLRNDIQKVAINGTVDVPEAMIVESYATVHQLVSIVEGVLREDKTALDLLRAVFPGGSMTGSPKEQSIDILEELEVVPRGIYSGSLLYLSNTGAMDCNVVIRTAIIEKDCVSIGIGGAIVEDSDPIAEYEEILLKAKGLLKSFELYYFGEERNGNPLGE